MKPTTNPDTNKTFNFEKTGFMPGDKVNSRYYVDYSGADAFVGLDLKISSTAAKPCAGVTPGQANLDKAVLLSTCTGTGTVPMFNGDKTSSLDLSVLPQNGASAHQLFNAADLEGFTTCDADAAGIITCTMEKKNIILQPRSGHTPSLPDDLVFHNGNADWITVDAGLSIDAPNQYQASTVKIDLTAHAVQWANNHGAVADSVGTTLPNGINGDPAGNQSALQFPNRW